MVAYEFLRTKHILFFRILSFKVFTISLIQILSLTLVTQTLVSAQEGEDPCKKLVCKWGEMCEVDKFGLAQCKCPTTCPDFNNTVCTVYGLEFPSRCEMHRYSCDSSVRISIRNQGLCKEDIPRSEACPTLDELVQFADRYLEWMFVAKSTFDDPSFKLEKRVTHLSINDRINIAKWEFERHDQDKNNSLQNKEIERVLQNMEYEPCGFGFIKSCDLDGRDGISQDEWIMSFNLAERELKRRLL